MMNSGNDTENPSRSAFAAVSGLLAFGVAMMGSLGSVYLSIGLGLKACPLCFYQRSFMMAAAVSLLMSFWLDGVRSTRSCFVALPFASAGLVVAAFHEYLVLNSKLECPPALFGWGDGPAQSLAVFGGKRPGNPFVPTAFRVSPNRCGADISHCEFFAAFLTIVAFAVGNLACLFDSMHQHLS